MFVESFLLTVFMMRYCAFMSKPNRVAWRTIASPFLVAVSLGAPLVPDALANEQQADTGTPVVLERGGCDYC